MQFNDSHRKKLSTLNIAHNRRFSALYIAVLAAFCSIWLFGACEAMGDGGVLGTDEPAGSGGTSYTLRGSIKTSDNKTDVLDSIVLRLRVKADNKNVKLASPESNGKYVITDIPEGEYTLTASHTDYVPQTIDLTVTGNMYITDILLVATQIEEKYDVKGKVSLTGGAGNLADAKVEIENLDTGSGATARVSSGGDYVFKVPEGRYSIAANLDGYIPRSVGNIVVPKDVPDKGDVPNMALEAVESTYTASGTVSLLDVSNNPVASVPTNTTVLFTNTGTGHTQTAHPSQNGQYSIGGLSGGSYKIEAVLAGYHQTTPVTQSIQANQTNINIIMRATGVPAPVYYTVSGHISTSDKNADISGAAALLTQGSAVKAVGVVQANGDYTISNVEAGSGYNIKVSHPGYTQNAITDFTVSANVTDKDIALTQIIPPTYTVSGNVALAGGSGNVANVTVSLKEVVSGTVVNVSPTAAGDYSFTGVQAGSYTVRAALDGYHANETSSFTVNANATAPNLTLDVKKFSISGKVELNGGSGSITGVVLTLKTGSTTVDTTRPVANGDYKFENLLAGDYIINASLAGFVPYESNPISLNANAAGQKIVLNAIAPQNYTVSGRIIAVSPGGASVDLLGGVSIPTANASDTGNFIIYNVPLGAYTLKVQLTGYVDSTQSINVLGDLNVGNITLTSSAVTTYTVSGIVTTGNGGSPGGADVELSGNGISKEAVTRANGSFTLQNVPAGTYTLRITLSGYSTYQENSFTVAGDTTKNVTLTATAGPPLTGTVTISGSPVVGQTLAAVTSGLGGSGDKYYQWIRGAANISGAISSTYIPVAADVGSTISVMVTRAGNSGSVTSAPTVAVTQPGLPPLTGTVTITGSPVVGQTLTANTSALDGTGAISYQWVSGASTNVGANSATYAPATADVGSTIKVLVIRAGYNGSVTSAPTAAVTQPVLPALTGSVSIIGSPFVGQMLTADTTSLGGSGVVNYQWVRGASTNISGATGSTYAPDTADVGSTIKVSVTRAGYSGTITSAATAAVTIPPITYNAKADGSATANTTVTSTKIDFTFDAAVTGLTAADITIGGGAANKENLTGSGKNWTLEITVLTAGITDVSINRAGIESMARSIPLFKNSVVRSSPDLSIKFGVTTMGTTTQADVTNTFNAVHAYLATSPKGTATNIGDIALGDYIDLVNLSIAADAGGGGGLTNATNIRVTGTGSGNLLRLIVVGINSFNQGQGGTYTGSGNGTDPHLVFQFQNIPVTHRMNSTNDNSSGYQCEMREYLNNNFLPGLTAAGVTQKYIWAPKRYVGSNPGKSEPSPYEDRLWLPTEFEIRGRSVNASSNNENDTNQARLAYYADDASGDASRVKSDGSAAQSYWLASPASNSSTSFCVSDSAGASAIDYASFRVGCAPAFCIK